MCGERLLLGLDKAGGWASSSELMVRREVSRTQLFRESPLYPCQAQPFGSFWTGGQLPSSSSSPLCAVVWEALVKSESGMAFRMVSKMKFKILSLVFRG